MDAAYQSSLDWFIKFTLRKNCRRISATTGCGTANVSDDESGPSSSSSPTTSASSSPLHRISLPGCSSSSTATTTTPATTTSADDRPSAGYCSHQPHPTTTPTTTTGLVTPLRLPAADLSSPSSSASSSSPAASSSSAAAAAASPAASFSSPSPSPASASASAPLLLPPWAVPQAAVDVLLRQWNWGFRENRPEDTCPNAVYWELYDRFPQREGHYRRQVQRDISALLRKVVPKDRVLGFEPTAEAAAESAYAPAPAAERVCRRGPPPGFGAAASAPATPAAPAVATSSCAPASGRICRRGPPPGFGAAAPVPASASPGLVVVQQGTAAVGGGSTRPAVRRSALTAALRREKC
ncbi:hypothetical protein PLESTB_001350100 [Pleodorina starrii]|uniref:Uncharacterized protein n=1 Tax=Pleodorina starrii TaxID=330485 RepID=A0A9W6BVN8_9CHLO|nr:hypothetical protein PLESTB_001350100 [Pleodorina starrii]